MTTALYLLRCYELGVPAADLDGLSVGAVFDMYTEHSNDSADWCEVATQSDFDKF
jgi:hypothetical protein